MKKSFILGEYLPRTTELKVLWEVPPPHWTGVSSYSLNTGNLRFRIRNFTSLSPAYRLNGVTRTLFAQGTSEFGNVCGIDGDFVNCGYGNFVSGFDEETRVLNYTELLEKHDLSSLSADPLYETLGEEYLATNAVAYVIFTQGENSRGFYEVQLNGGNYEWVLTEREQSITFDTSTWSDEDLEITLAGSELVNNKIFYEDLAGGEIPDPTPPEPEPEPEPDPTENKLYKVIKKLYETKANKSEIENIAKIVNLKSVTDEPLSAVDGDLYFNDDTDTIWEYQVDTWVDTESPPSTDTFYTFDGSIYLWDGTNLIEFDSDIDLSGYVQKTDLANYDTVLFVAQNGDDSENDGKNPNRPYLTIAKALVGITSGTVINVLDNGEYAENITLPSGVSLCAKMATIKGTIVANAGANVQVCKHTPSANSQTLFTNQGGAEHTFYRFVTNDCLTFTGITNIKNQTNNAILFVEGELLYAGQRGIQDFSGGAEVGGHIHFNIKDLYQRGNENNCTLIDAGGTSSDIIGFSDHLIPLAGTGHTALRANNGGKIRVVLNEIRYTGHTAYNQSGTSKIYLQCLDINGTKTGTAIITTSLTNQEILNVQNLVSDGDGLSHLANDGTYKTTPIAPTISTDIEADATSDVKTASPKAVKTYVDGKVSTVYKPAGSLTEAQIVSGLLVVGNLGNVYNVTEDFTTFDNLFKEPNGQEYPAGTNIVVVDIGGENYKFDILAGFIDLSDYAKIEDLPTEASDIDAVDIDFDSYTEKETVVDNDLLVINDSEASGAVKYLKISNLPIPENTVEDLIGDTKVWRGTQAEFDIETNEGANIDSDTIYFILEEKVVTKIFLGSNELSINNLGHVTIPISEATEYDELGETSDDVITEEVLKAILDDEDYAKKDEVQNQLETATVEILVEDWSVEGTVTKTVTGITATNIVWVSPVPASFDKYGEFGIRATVQGTNQLTFACLEIPDATVNVNIVIGDE